MDNLPAPLAAAFTSGTPMQQMLGQVLDELGGLDFVVNWAEECPGDFMRLLMAATPSPTAGGSGGTHIHVHPALAPGPLDIEGEVVEG